MACNIIVEDLQNIEIAWDGMSLPLQHGLADESEAISIEFTAADVEVKVSATGFFSYIASNTDMSGDVTMSFMQGTPQLSQLREMAYGIGFLTRGDMTITNLLSGENFVLECAGLKNRPSWTTGSGNDGVVEVMFNFSRITGYTPAQSLQGA